MLSRNRHFSETSPQAPEAGGTAGGGPAINATVFHTDHIESVSPVTQVFGRGQRVTAVIVGYDAPIANEGLGPDRFAVADRNITRVYANDRPVPTETGKDGACVVLEMNPDDPAAITSAPGIDRPGQVVVAQTQPIHMVAGGQYEPTDPALINTRQLNLIVDEFQQLRFVDAETGLILNYNLFIPGDYDPARAYPLRTLEQGLGAVAFASPRDQARHPAFVLAPQYPVGLANDAAQISDYPDITVRLIEALQTQYNLDVKRLYTTGQSGGAMASITLNIRYPDLFAASLLVAGQWDLSLVAPLAQDRLWVIVSQDDAKAYPGMNAIMQVLEQNGAGITRMIWDGRSRQEQLDANVAEMQAAGPNSNVFYAAFAEGTVIPEGESRAGAAGHVNTWRIAYDIPAVRDWLMSQSK
ncbi:MAG: PHB depolymerase family esterase [Paracoccus sp. (in: a-proteobacteria)]